MSKQLKPGGLQYVSRVLANKYDVSLSTFVLIDATRNGNIMTEIAELYGVNRDGNDSYQFLSTCQQEILSSNFQRHEYDEI